MSASNISTTIACRVNWRKENYPTTMTPFFSCLERLESFWHCVQSWRKSVNQIKRQLWQHQNIKTLSLFTRLGFLLLVSNIVQLLFATKEWFYMHLSWSGIIPSFRQKCGSVNMRWERVTTTRHSWEFSQALKKIMRWEGR